MQEYPYLCALLRAAVGNGTVPQAPEGLSFPVLFTLAKRQGVAGTAFYALEKRPVPTGQEALFARWAALRDRWIVRYETQEYTAAQIARALTEAQVDCLRLKGGTLARLYPIPAMRFCADLDFLIPSARRTAARTVMEACGFETVSFDADVHDVYLKPPFLNVELHGAPFSPAEKALYAYWGDGWPHAAAAGDREGGSPQALWEFSPESFYLYNLCHISKHLKNAGIGLRSLLDAFLLQRADPGAASSPQVRDGLRRCGVASEANALRTLAERYFGKTAAAGNIQLPDAQTLEARVRRGSLYGTVRELVTLEQKKHGTGCYLLRRIFPPPEQMRKRYLALRARPYLLPLYWLRRLFTLHGKTAAHARAELVAVFNNLRKRFNAL